MRAKFAYLTALSIAALVALAPEASAADVDLQVTGVAPMTVPVCAGTTPTIRATIRNNGSSDSGSFNIRWIVDNTLTFDGGHLSIPGGATDTHDHIWSSGTGAGPTPIALGTHTVRFIADVDGSIGETSESNNEGILTFDAVTCNGSVPDKYVALGDSFSSGDGALDYIPSSGACRQSKNAYPEVLATGLASGAQVPSNLVFYACSGAKVADVRSNQLPLFRVIVPASVKLVTITISGNDVDFAGALRNCFGGDLRTVTCVAQTPAVSRKVLAQFAPLTSLYRSIRTAAPQARVLVLGYPDLFPQRPSQTCDGFSKGSQTWFNTEEQLLDDTIKQATKAAGVEFVATYGAFVGHDICSADPYANGYPAPTTNQLAFHPKPIGQAKLAAVVGDYLKAHPAMP